MPGVDWPAVGADPSRVAARFLAFLGALVVQLTKRLKLAEEEFLLITFMWLDVVCDRCSIDAPIFQAHLAQWLRTQLMLCAPPPYRRAIKMMPTTLSLRHCCSPHSVLAIDRVPFGVHTNGSALSSLPVSRNRLGWACAIVCVSALIKFAYTWPARALNQHGLGPPRRVRRASIRPVCLRVAASSCGSIPSASITALTMGSDNISSGVGSP
jgi:hypothetical protein